MNADEKTALAALKQLGIARPAKQCASCKSPFVEKIDLLLKMAETCDEHITMGGFYASLKVICPNYPLTDSGLRRHLRSCRAEQADKALG